MYKVCDNITIKWNRGGPPCTCEIRNIFPQRRYLLVHHKGGLALISYDDVVRENEKKARMASPVAQSRKCCKQSRISGTFEFQTDAQHGPREGIPPEYREAKDKKCQFFKYKGLLSTIDS
jgi:hypothetical protein